MDAEAEQARAVWAQGRYAEIAPRLEPAAEALCEATGVGPGVRVLDVGAGTGNVALAAAARGAAVVASDVAPALIAQGRERAREAGADIEWVEADARALPFPDGAFDAVLSCFGAIFAPEPDRVAAELLRVTAPGGTAALTAWVPTGVQAAAFEALGRHLPARPGPGPEAWGDPAVARSRLAPHADAVGIERRSLRWRFAGGVAGWVDDLGRNAPPVVAARRALGEQRWAAVVEDLHAVVRAAGAEEEPGGAFVVEPEYLIVAARRAA